jgi:hypothetical protein
MATLVFHAVADDLVVFVSGAAAYADEEWQEYVRHAENVAPRWRHRADIYKYFIFVDDGAPNAAQRGSVMRATEGVKGRAAVVTGGLLARKIITAFGWLGAPMRGFAPSEVRAAAEYLQLDNERLHQVIQTARTLAPLIGKVHAVDAIAVHP